MLSSGNIPDLFAREEYDAIFQNIRSAAKVYGYADDRESLLQFFIDRVRRNLHLILCHSPVGNTFRIRGRKFPALISCMVLDVFHPWPREALNGVAQRFLDELYHAGNIKSEETLVNIAAHMAEVHLSIDVSNRRFLEEERRHNYTTPKSFLELINFYVKMLTDKQADVTFNINRLEKGLTIMEQVQSKVGALRQDLNETLDMVEKKKDYTKILIEEVTVARDEAIAEKEKADVEEEKCTSLADAAQEIEMTAKRELEEALPAMEAAKKAIDCLDKSAIQELKSMTKPPHECEAVCAACGFLLKHTKSKLDWKGAVKMMNNPAQFLEDVKAFDANVIPENVLNNTDLLINLPYFNFETMKNKSYAAACLANWVVNIVRYHKIYRGVEPLMKKVKQAKEQTEKAERELVIVRKHVREVEAHSQALDKKLSDAVNDKEEVEHQAKLCNDKLCLAKRLVDGLADENDRWSATVANLKDLGIKLIGNCLLASAFVGYISPFSSHLRLELWRDTWTKDLIQRQIPMTEQIDPLTVLASDADVASWLNEGLPSDRISIENASILTSCSRWPLMIDPQQQGLRWIKQRIGEDLVIIQLSMSKWLEKVIFCIQLGSQLLIEAVGSEIDAILEPVLSRSIIKRKNAGMSLKIAGDEIDYDAKFQLYLQSKLPNPHYRPEIAAQCTIINFIVTPEGLEDQILAMVVNAEKQELEQEKQALVRQQNDFKVQLSKLEDDLLTQLSEAESETILNNLTLIEGLEKTKLTSKEISQQVASARDTEIEINRSRELYRPVAAEGSILFFLVNQLCIIEHMYQYSLDSFVTFLYKAIDRTEASEDIKERTSKLIAMIRMIIFRWVNRGLFEDHKLIFSTMLTFRLFQLGQLSEEFNKAHFNFLLWGPSAVLIENPLAEWLPNQAWAMVMKLIELEGFEQIAQNMEKDAPNRFKEWFNELTPEDVKLPLDWKRLDLVPFQKLLVIRCLRPDRMAMALCNWVRGILPNGRDYTECDSSRSFYEVLSSSYEDSTNVTPFFFILSPGADPVKEVEALGRKIIQLQANVNYHNVAMGQGQDVVAMQKLDLGHKEGHWVMLQNIHLMPNWCIELEKRLDVFAAENSHPNFRLFVSADPCKGIPIGVLERSIKLTNEPPQGLQANLRRSFALFSKEDFEERDPKIKSILFGLCHFHSLMVERKKFGPLGYNMKYPFSSGDLRDSASVLYNYLEGSTSVKIPWEDLRYIFGAIMYGGHIVDDRDRNVCEKYLNYFMQDELLDEKEMVPYADGKLSWKSPGPGAHEKYLEHIESMPPESPLFFGMHPNAEIRYRMAQCDNIFALLNVLQPKKSTGGNAESETSSPLGRAEDMCSEVLGEVQDVKFHTEDTSRALTDEDKGPYQFVLFQECDQMNALVNEMVRGLSELQLGLKGELTMSEPMELLADALNTETLPFWWVKLGFPSTRPLKLWLVNLKERCAQLDDWIPDPLSVPKVVDVSKLFSPQSFLTAIKQVCCQTQSAELDKLQVFTEVTKRDVKQIDTAAREGAFVTGMYLEGARWDINANSLEDSKPKEMFTRMPVINCKAAQPEREDKNIYNCPTYCVPTRRPYFVFSAQLRTKQPPAKWVLAGVALILDIGYNL